MLPDVELARRRTALNGARAAQWQALQDLRGARSRGVNRRLALSVFQQRVVDLEAARLSLADMQMIMRIERHIPGLLDGVPEIYGYDVKIRAARGNAISVYYGGLGMPDGPGHGHLVVNQYGRITYQRGPWMSRGIHNYR